jgi:hypothetical protein
MIARPGRKASRRRDRFTEAEAPTAPGLLKDTSRASISAALPGGRGGFAWNWDPIVSEQLLQLGDSGVDTAVPAILQGCLALNIAAAPVGRGAEAQLESQWPPFEAQVKAYFETTAQQIEQQQAAFRPKRWLRCVDQRQTPLLPVRNRLRRFKSRLSRPSGPAVRQRPRGRHKRPCG